MSTSAYLNDVTADLLNRIEDARPWDKRVNILHRALELYAVQLGLDEEFEVGHIDSINQKNQSHNCVSKTTDEIRIPDKVGDFESVNTNSEHNQTSGFTVDIGYKNEDLVCILKGRPEGCYTVTVTRDDYTVSEKEFLDIGPAIAYLNTWIVPLDDSLLTRRECEVWWLTRDNTHEEVSNWLDMSEETVNTHLSNISKKRKQAESTFGMLSMKI